MILVRKNELDVNILNFIMKKKEVYHYDFDILFNGENWTDHKMSSFFESVDSEMEEYKILKSLFHSDKVDVDISTRSFLYMIASLRNYSISKSVKGLNLISTYLLCNIVDLKELKTFENNFWDVGMSDEMSKIDCRISINFIMDLIVKKSKIINSKKIDADYFSYHRKSLSYKKLRERYFLIKNKSLLKNVLHDKNFDEVELSMPDKKNDMYFLTNFTNLKTIREKLFYIPNDVFCFCIDSFVENKICLPILNNIIYFKNSKYAIYDFTAGCDVNLINDMRKIHNDIYNSSSLIHRCDSKEIKVIFRRISNGKI